MQRDNPEQLSALQDEEKDEFELDRPLLSEHEKMADPEDQDPGQMNEKHTSRTRTIAYLSMYFMMNLSLTFYNKLVLGSVGDFRKI